MLIPQPQLRSRITWRSRQVSVHTLRIGDLADQTGVSVSAIRFYEAKGLITPDARTAGQRRYTPAAVERLRLILTFRNAGLAVSDIAAALDRNPDRAAQRRADAAQRAVDLREQLKTTVTALVVVEHASQCHRDPDDTRCIDEINHQRDHALRQAQHLLSTIGPAMEPAP